MIVLRVTDVKSLMKKLLYEDDFDSFLLSEATIKMGSSFLFDGHINKNFYTDEEITILKDEALLINETYDPRMVRWRSVKSHVLSIIKGKKTPLSFNIIFYLPTEKTKALLESLESADSPDSLGLMIQLRFDDSGLKITTGTVHAAFTLDNSTDKKWDENVMRLLSDLSISFEQL